MSTFMQKFCYSERIVGRKLEEKKRKSTHYIS